MSSSYPLKLGQPFFHRWPPRADATPYPFTFGYEDIFRPYQHHLFFLQTLSSGTSIYHWWHNFPDIGSTLLQLWWHHSPSLVTPLSNFGSHTALSSAHPIKHQGWDPYSTSLSSLRTFVCDRGSSAHPIKHQGWDPYSTSTSSSGTSAWRLIVGIGCHLVVAGFAWRRVFGGDKEMVESARSCLQNRQGH